MSFLNELWKKFKSPIQSQIQGNKVTAEKFNTENSLQATVSSEALLKSFSEHETEYLQSKQILDHLKSVKAILEGEKEHNLEYRAKHIQQVLGVPESYEALRQERWEDEIQCPSCRSTHLKRILPLTHNLHNHRYQCQSCWLEFNDDTGTPIEVGIPPINIWMQCWYLMGCTDSFIFIAHKLNLDLSTVERMVEQLKKIFQAQKPLQNNLEFEEWTKKSEHLRKLLNEDLMKQLEVLDANVVNTPRDTTEFRRQQNLRRNLKASTDPLSPNTSPNFTRKR